MQNRAADGGRTQNIWDVEIMPTGRVMPPGLGPA